MRRNAISQTKRQVIFARDDWRCCYCGTPGNLTVDTCRKPMRRRVIPRDPEGRMYEVDHVLSVANGGDNSLSNLVTSCWKCNNKKGSSTKKPSYQMFRIDL
jgi:5-methylcytosine-specific restriction endonuclease McrA